MHFRSVSVSVSDFACKAFTDGRKLNRFGVIFAPLPCRFLLLLQFPLSPAKPSRTDENLTASA
nr:MAG TPA: hypothetical protein [Caudoviricetes sp.]